MSNSGFCEPQYQVSRQDGFAGPTVAGLLMGSPIAFLLNPLAEEAAVSMGKCTYCCSARWTVLQLSSKCLYLYTQVGTTFNFDHRNLFLQ